MDGVNIDGTYSDDGIEFSQTRFLREDEGFENVYSGTGSIWKINLYPSPSVSFSGGTSASNPAGTYTGDGPGATGSPVVTLTAATTATPQAGESPETNPEKWQLQEIPLLLAEYAARAAKADYLSDDGQDDKSLAQDRRAIDWLELQMVNITVLQNQTSNYRVRGE